MTFEQIKELVQLVAERRLQGLELEDAEFRLKIEGQAPAPVAAAPAMVPAPAHVAPAVPLVGAATSLPPAGAAPEAGAPAAGGELAGSHTITSPIVGTFYRAPSPDSEPFVEVGQRVKKGQVLCIVEAMKLMNEIESDVDGVIAKVFPNNAQPVEFGEPLFAVQPQ